MDGDLVAAEAQGTGLAVRRQLVQEPLSPGDFIGRWMDLLTPAAESVNANSWMTSAERQTALERISIRHSIANLRSFPCVEILEGKGRLSLHGAWFDIASGELWIMDQDSGDFVRPSGIEP